MELNLLEIWNTMGFMARFVAIALVVMGIASLYVGIERFLVLNGAEASSSAFAAKAKGFLDARDFDGLLDLAKLKQFEKTPLARLMKIGLEAYRTHEDDPSVGPVELTRRELSRKLEVISAEARRGMNILASTGSTAPFVGLFGTVLGIITAFQGIAAAGGGGIGAVSAGIAEALIVTAVGLAVAISAVLVFNYLTARFDKLDMSIQHAAGELVDFLESVRGRAA
jgi:biopolymer transport protein ExbB/TolQ